MYGEHFVFFGILSRYFAIFRKTVFRTDLYSCSCSRITTHPHTLYHARNCNFGLFSIDILHTTKITRVRYMT